MIKTLISTILVLLVIIGGVLGSAYLSGKELVKKQLKKRYEGIVTYKIIEPVLFRNVDKIKAGSQEAEAFLSIGTNFYALNDFKRAVYWYHRSQKLNPANFSIEYNIAQSHVQLKEYESAKMHFLKAIEINPLYYTAYFELASLYVNHFKNSVHEMESLYQSQIEKNPNDETLKAGLKELHRLQGKDK